MRVGFRRINLIEFIDGTFGIRYGWFFHEYQDFASRTCTWGKKSQYFNDCKASKEVATSLFEKIVEGEKIIR